MIKQILQGIIICVSYKKLSYYTITTRITHNLLTYIPKHLRQNEVVHS
jgi:hypothetical protein